ncbi:ras gtpase-related [Anaeramoeba ignava]|uniref:small monomeric GTPase n=1 Tax=Anaeramoeba ignava TaxID=1746090 RepID=A0A9Q0LQP2_ANAIG|nr:ras gtpase-related [Anaeramoeba ignava]
MSIIVKLVVLGSGGVGKSALTTQFLQKQFLDHYDPTIEESYRKQMDIDDVSYVLDILDTAGQEEYISMREKYMANGHGFLFVFSVISRLSFEYLSDLHHSLCRVKDTEDIPIVIAGNKADLQNQRVVSHDEAKAFGDSIHGPYFETSAKTNTNVDEAFFQLVREVRKAKKIVVANPSNSTKKFKCCQIL